MVPQSPMDKSGKGPLSDDTFTFDQTIKYTDSSGNPFAFQVVMGKTLLRRGPVSKCYMVRALVATSEAPTFVLKQTDLDTVIKDHNSYKKQLQVLETELEQLKKISHQNILELLDFKVHKTIYENGESDSSWTVSILSEFAEKGSLEELLDITGNLGVGKVRSWTIELLDALRYLHDHGITHQDIHCGNVLLVRGATGEVKPKLADAGYERKLHHLCSRRQPAGTLAVAKSAYWLPPEVANSEHPQYTQKTDIWDFGILFLQMVFGLTVFRKYTSPMALAESLALSPSLDELVHRLFKADAKKRPRAFELSSSEFLATDAPILEEDTSPVASRLGSISLIAGTPRRQRHDSMNTGGPFSRYLEDFVEEGRLGKGGFGEVVKARKKLDGQIYAIKKITQKSSASLTEVLKEVRLLSQLSHPYVVRKYMSSKSQVLSPIFLLFHLKNVMLGCGIRIFNCWFPFTTISLAMLFTCPKWPDFELCPGLRQAKNKSLYRLTIQFQGYYNTWTEEIPDSSETDDDATSTDGETTDASISSVSPGEGPEIDFETSTGGLDFMSSSGYPQIEFGYDEGSDTDAVEDENDHSTSPEDHNLNTGNEDNNAYTIQLALPTAFQNYFIHLYGVL
jgi:serine/threonine protein kinase